MPRAHELLEGLDPSQRAAVTNPRGPLAVIGGPGSGKTRVLTTRIAWRAATGDAAPSRTLVVTFSRRGAKGFARQLQRAGLAGSRPTVTTLVAFAALTLQRAWREAGEAPPWLEARPARLLAPLVGAHRGPLPSVDVVASEVAWAKARGVPPDAYASFALRASRLPAFGEQTLASVADVYRAYEAKKARHRVLDVDDLIPALTARLAVDRRLAARLQWHHRHLYVDEFQDVGLAAFRLVEALAGAGLGDTPVQPDLTVAGDPDQAVYGSAGGDRRLLLRLGQALPGTATVLLTTTHRTPRGALAAARGVLTGGATGRTPTSAGAARPAAAGGDVEAIGHGSSADEAAAVAEALRGAHRSGYRWSDLAVLGRTSRRLKAVAAACAAAGVPIRSGRGFLERSEVTAAIDTLLRLRPPTAPADDCRSVLHQLAAEAAGRPGLGAAGPSALQTLAALADEYANGIGGTLGGFLTWLDVTVRAQGGEPAEEGDAVDLLTFHQAKGLEWDIVHVVGFEEGTVPRRSVVEPPRARDRQPAYTGSTRTSKAHRQTLAEERRLAHLALTRARVSVRCSWVGTPSRWLAPALEAASAGSSRTSEPTAPPQAAPQTPSDPVLDALRQWRDDRTSASGLAPSAVLADALLRRIALRRPTTLMQLAAIPGIGAATRPPSAAPSSRRRSPTSRLDPPRPSGG